MVMLKNIRLQTSFFIMQNMCKTTNKTGQGGWRIQVMFQPNVNASRKIQVFLFIVTHPYEASIYISVPWIVGNAT